jgi:hypothetical protein
MRARKDGLGVFGGGTTLPTAFDRYERASVIGAAVNLPEAPKASSDLRSRRLPGWNFHIPLTRDSGVVASHLLTVPEQPGDEELRALAALLRLPPEESITAERLAELARMLKIDEAVFLGVAKALAEVPEEARGPALARAEHLLGERDRLALEALCSELFTRVVLPLSPCPVSLLLFSYAPGHVAYKTALDRAAFGQAMHELTESWRTGKPRAIHADRPLALPSAEEAQSLLDAAREALPSEKRAELGAALIFGEPPATLYVSSGDREGMQTMLATLAENVALDDAVDIVRAARQVVRDWHCPRGAIRSPQQCEVFAMNAAHAFGVLGWRPGMSQTATDAWEERAVLGTRNNPAFDSLFRRMCAFLGGEHEAGDCEFLGFEGARFNALTDFLHGWRLASYARLEVGHRLAAALCLTDVPADVDVRAPWPCWSLVLPDGLIPTLVAGQESAVRAARLWIAGTEVLFVVLSNGLIIPSDGSQADAGGLISNLVRGACLALSNPADFRKDAHHRPTARASKKGRSGPPELAQARYLLSAPVKIDLREHLRGVLEGRKGAAPTVQFLVRGHWRNQAHGPRRSLRRVQWIEPFWKGPEEARVLLRQHKVDE